MPNIYWTDNMEAAAIQMVERNDRCVMLHTYWNERRIRIRTHELSVLSTIICRTHDAFAQANIDKWRQMRGLLDFRSKRVDMVPKCDAMLFVECPPSLVKFNEYAEKASGEVIVYRPPTWTLHESTLTNRTPTSNTHYTFDLAVAGLRGRQLTRDMSSALNVSGHPDTASVFTGEEIEMLTGIAAKDVPRIMTRSVRYWRYTPVVPVVPPDDQVALDLYDQIEAMPEHDGGVRLIPHRQYSSVFNGMARRGNLIVEPDIYVVNSHLKAQRYNIVNSMANVKRGDWFKMKQLVESSPKYPIEPQLLARLSEIRSAKYAYSLFLGRLYGKAGSTPQE